MTDTERPSSADLVRAKGAGLAVDGQAAFRGAEVARAMGTRIALDHTVRVPNHHKHYQYISIIQRGKRLAARGLFGEVCIWDIESGELCDGVEANLVDGLASARDTSAVLFAISGTAILYNEDLAKRATSWEIPEDEVVDGPNPTSTFAPTLDLSVDGRLGLTVVSGSLKVRVWSTANGGQAALLEHARQQPGNDSESDWGVTNAVFAEDGEHVVTSVGTRIFVWEIRTALTVASRKFTGRIKAILVTGSGIVQAMTFDGRVVCWDWGTGEVHERLLTHAADLRHQQAFTFDGGAVVGAVVDSTRLVVESEAKGEVVLFESSGAAINAVGADKFGPLLAALQHDGQIRVWDSQSLVEVNKFGDEQPPSDFAFTRSGAEVITCGPNGQITLVDAATGASIRSVSTEAFVLSKVMVTNRESAIARGLKAFEWNFELDPSGTRVIASGLSMEFDLSNDSLPRFIGASPSTRFTIHHDAESGQDGLVVWDLEADSARCKLDIPVNPVSSAYDPKITWLPGEDRLLTESFGTFQLWDLTEARIVDEIDSGHGSAIKATKLLPDGRGFACLLSDGQLVTYRFV